MNNPNHVVTWIPPRPEFTIRYTRGTSTQRGYHESYFEVISLHEVSDEAFTHLDACGLLGVGQEYRVMKHEQFTEDAPPVTVDRSTGQVLPDVPPLAWNGQPYTHSQRYEYHRYTVRRICDSGD